MTGVAGKSALSIAAIRGRRGFLGKKLCAAAGIKLPRRLQAMEEAPTRSTVRHELDSHRRDILATLGHVGSLFKDTHKAFMTGASTRNVEASAENIEVSQHGKGSERRVDTMSNPSKDQVKKDFRVNLALRAYRLLRPEAQPFYKEDAQLSMAAGINELHARVGFPNDSGTGESRGLVGSAGEPQNRLSMQLPIVNHNAFMIAIESVAASLCSDLEALCDALEVDFGHISASTPHSGERLEKLLNLLRAQLSFSRDPSRVHVFMGKQWPRIAKLLPTEAAESFSKSDVEKFLHDHLVRIAENQKRVQSSGLMTNLHSRISSQVYSFPDDFPYDSLPLSPHYVDEINVEFPVEKAGDFLNRALSFSGLSADICRNLCTQFQDFVYTCTQLGLRNWIKTDYKSEIASQLPRGPVMPLERVSEGDLQTAQLLIRCAARGKPNLLDLEILDPIKLMHGFKVSDPTEEVSTLPIVEPFKSDEELDKSFDLAAAAARLRGLETVAEGAAPGVASSVQALIESELGFYRNAGPVTVSEISGKSEWAWKKPDGAVLTPGDASYTRQNLGVDPQLNPKSFRRVNVDTKRMGAYWRNGRVVYFRSIVVVGNALGTYGVGVGFGHNWMASQAAGTVRAFRNLKYIDMDPNSPPPFKVRGVEYGARVEIDPLPRGSGLRSPRRFQPLLHVIGLDNCRVRFNHAKPYTRIRALMRALDQLVSRRTLSNMTGKRYMDIVAPGDNWVHWPDAWFSNVEKDFAAHEALKERERPYGYLSVRRPKSHGDERHVKKDLLTAGPSPHAWLSPLERSQRTRIRRAETAGQISQRPTADFAPGPQLVGPSES